MFGIVVLVYLGIGIAAEYCEELYVQANAKRIFQEHVKPKSVFNPLNPILERTRGYNIEWFLTDLSDLVLWPFGLVWQIRGIQKFKTMTDDEILEVLTQYEKEH